MIAARISTCILGMVGMRRFTMVLIGVVVLDTTLAFALTILRFQRDRLLGKRYSRYMRTVHQDHGMISLAAKMLMMRMISIPTQM